MFLRWTVLWENAFSGRTEGVFSAAYDLLAEEGDAAVPGLRECLAWFDEHLAAPKHVPRRAVFWMRAEASQAVSRMWILVSVLKAHGVPVRLLQSRRPGYVRYADPCQVAAEPVADTLTTHGRAAHV